MKVGIVLGRFSPIHHGHTYMIEESAKKVDKLYVAVCFTDGETVPATVRTVWVQESLRHLANVQIVTIYDQIGSSSDGSAADEGVSREWARYLKNRFPDITHFCGAASYVRMMAESIGAESIVTDIDHRKHNISSSSIRNDLELLDSSCINLVVEQYIPRIAIVGIESVGKTTLSKKLSELLNAEFIDEYGRIYCEIHAPLEEGKDYFLTRQDFHNIAIGHNRLMLRAYERALKKRRNFVISDTEHIVTQAFYKRYLYEYDRKIRDMCNFQTYDIYFYLKPLNLEDDGTRRIFSSAERRLQNEELLQMFLERRDVNGKLHVVESMPFEERLQYILQIIQCELNKFIR